LIVVSALLLTACGGTAVRKDAAGVPVTAGSLNVRTVQARVSAQAKEQLPDNIKFDLDALRGTVDRALSAAKLEDAASGNMLDIEVTNVYIRGTFTAVMFGLFAGGDNISGNVRVTDPQGNPLRSFEVSASYALGGYAGGQDSIRLNYLYEKFAELTREQLADRR
jgi:hypothetical protein